MEAFNTYYLDILKTKYALFDGRAGRQEFWMFVLFNVIVSVVLAIIDAIIGVRVAGGFGLLGTLYSLAVVVPGLAIGCRRLHDIGKSGWLQLLGLIPFVGALILIFAFYINVSSPGDNQFGPNPKGL